MGLSFARVSWNTANIIFEQFCGDFVSTVIPWFSYLILSYIARMTTLIKKSLLFCEKDWIQLICVLLWIVNNRSIEETIPEIFVIHRMFSAMHLTYYEVWYGISMLLDTSHSLTVASARIFSYPVIDKSCVLFSQWSLWFYLKTILFLHSISHW